MHANDMPEPGTEIKRLPEPAHKFWIALYKDVLQHELIGIHADRKRRPWPPFQAWVWMLLTAAARPYKKIVKGRPVDLTRGQMVLTERHLAKEANWSRKEANAFMTRLERFDMIRLSTVSREGQYLLDFAGTKRGPARGPTLTIVTICNYDVYQFGLHKQGATQGAARGPVGGQDIHTVVKKEIKSHQSPMEIGIKKDQSSNFGTDGTDQATSNVVQLRRPMVMDAPGAEFKIPSGTRTKIEALGVDADELLDRMYEQIDKGRRIGSKSRYLITSAINAAHERDGTPKDVLKAVISGNKFAKQDAIVTAASAQAVVMEEIALRARINSTRRSGQTDLVKALKK